MRRDVKANVNTVRERQTNHPSHIHTEVVVHLGLYFSDFLEILYFMSSSAKTDAVCFMKRSEHLAEAVLISGYDDPSFPDVENVSPCLVDCCWLFPVELVGKVGQRVVK